MSKHRIANIMQVRSTIERLTAMINNWAEIAENVEPRGKTKSGFYFVKGMGLCFHANFDEDNDIVMGAIQDWCDKFNPGVDATYSYWLAGQYEFADANLWLNPKRLHAAIFIRNRLIDRISEVY